MNFDQLEAFVSVATLGGFTSASRHLHRTQPAISRRVQQLEDALGTKLFMRIGREVRLSSEGETFLPYAQAALASLREGINTISSAGDDGGVPLRVATVGTLADTQLAAVLQEFRKSSGAEVALRTATSREVSMLVQRGEADIGIRYFADFHRGIESILLGEERLILIASAAHRLAEKRNIRANELAEEQWLSFPYGDGNNPDSFGHLLQRALLDIGISEPRQTFVDSLTAQKRLAQAGYDSHSCPRASAKTNCVAAAYAGCRSTGSSHHSPSSRSGDALRRHKARSRSFSNSPLSTSARRDWQSLEAQRGFNSSFSIVFPTTKHHEVVGR